MFTRSLIAVAALSIAACSVTLPMGSVSANGMETEGEITGSLAGSTITFSVVGTDTTCLGESSPDGTSTIRCSDGTVTTFTFPEDQYGKMNGWYYSAEGNGAGPTVSGWGTFADRDWLAQKLSEILAEE